LRSFLKMPETETSTWDRVLPIRALVSEPDSRSRRLICSLLECESGIIVACADDSKFVSAVSESAPDLVIVDVHAPAIRQARSWEAVGVNPAPITIITGYDPSTVSPFASSAIDFLVKPFDAERFGAALDRAKSEIARARMDLEPEAGASVPEQKQSVRPFLQRLAVEADERIVVVKVEDIRWMQAAGNYIRLHVGKSSHLLRRSMKNLQTLLDPNRFLRVHRNAIVNLDHVEEFHLPPSGNMFVKLNDGLCLPLRKANRALLRRLLKNIS
jgi:two-component system, LytTR family, response regulator